MIILVFKKKLSGKFSYLMKIYKISKQETQFLNKIKEIQNNFLLHVTSPQNPSITHYPVTYGRPPMFWQDTGY